VKLLATERVVSFKHVVIRLRTYRAATPIKKKEETSIICKLIVISKSDRLIRMKRQNI